LEAKPNKYVHSVRNSVQTPNLVVIDGSLPDSLSVIKIVRSLITRSVEFIDEGVEVGPRENLLHYLWMQG
jgi:hypothetical protein